MALAIGAGQEQLPWILRAKHEGYRVTVLDANPSAPALSCGDQAIVVDIHDVDKVIGIACRYGVELTIPSPIGNAIVTLGAVHDAMGIPGVSKESAQVCSDKAKFSQCMRDAALRVPRETSFDSLDELESYSSRLTWPLVVKPRYGSGSRGVMVINGEREFAEIVANKSSASHYSRGLLAQEFIDGLSLGVDGAVVGKDATVTLIRRKLLTPLPFRVEFQYASPSGISEQAEVKVRTLINAAVKALQLEQTVFHADLIIVPDGEVFLIELSARPSGLMLSSKMVKLATGVDFIGEAIKLHAGYKACFEPKFTRSAIVHYWASRGGTVRTVAETSDLEKIREVEDFKLGVRLGSFVQAPTCVAELLPHGYVVLCDFGDVDSIGKMQSVISSVRIE